MRKQEQWLFQRLHDSASLRVLSLMRMIKSVDCSWPCLFLITFPQQRTYSNAPLNHNMMQWHVQHGTTTIIQTSVSSAFVQNSWSYLTAHTVKFFILKNKSMKMNTGLRHGPGLSTQKTVMLFERNILLHVF